MHACNTLRHSISEASHVQHTWRIDAACPAGLQLETSVSAAFFEGTHSHARVARLRRSMRSGDRPHAPQPAAERGVFINHFEWLRVGASRWESIRPRALPERAQAHPKREGA